MISEDLYTQLTGISVTNIIEILQINILQENLGGWTVDLKF